MSIGRVSSESKEGRPWISLSHTLDIGQRINHGFRQASLKFITFHIRGANYCASLSTWWGQSRLQWAYFNQCLPMFSEDAQYLWMMATCVQNEARYSIRHWCWLCDSLLWTESLLWVEACLAPGSRDKLLYGPKDCDRKHSVRNIAMELQPSHEVGQIKGSDAPPLHMCDGMVMCNKIMYYLGVHVLKYYEIPQ